VVVFGHRLPALPFIALRSEITARQPMCLAAGLHNQGAAALMHYLPESLVSAIVRRGSAKYHLES